MFSNKILRVYTLIIAVLFLSGCASRDHIVKVDKFKYPDIKAAFCGTNIDFHYCKCAFHGDYCKELGLSKKEADKIVREKYNQWLKTRINAFGTTCVIGGGMFNPEDVECSYCEDGYEVKDGRCEGREAEKKEVKDVSGADILGSGCKIKSEEFGRDWKKYSDIDSRIPYEERSYEAKQVLTLNEEMIALTVEGFGLEREAEVDKLAMAELQNYRNALSKNIKTNLLKSFWRLAWITYSTIDSGKGMGETYSELMSGVETAAEAVGKGLKLIQGVVPNDSALAIDTESFSGKVKSVGLNTALEAVSSLGDPVATATEFFNSSASVNFPSADLSEEEFAILKEQHLKKGAIDEALKAGAARSASREARIAQIESKISELKGQISSWEEKEKERTRVLLEDGCEKSKS